MANNTTTPANTQVRPQAQHSTNEVSIKDLWYLSLAHWPWYVVSVIICLALASFYLLRTPKMYTRSASILIKEDQDSKSIGTDVARVFQDMSISPTSTNVYNELISLRSNDVALAVTKRLDLNVFYTVSGTFHDYKLYGTTQPIKVEFPNASEEDFISFDISLKSDGHYKITNLQQNNVMYDDPVEGQVGYNIVNTKAGRIVVLKTRNYNKTTTSKTIHVSRCPYEVASGSVGGRFSCELDDKNATVIDMAFVDVSPECAEDVLNTYISVYNENWVKDKNQIAVSTSEFINERLAVIQRELGTVDVNISSYKSANGITDLQATSAMYLQQSSTADAQMLKLNNQIYMARYIRNYLAANGNNYQLLPTNTGIEDVSLSTQIQQYNNTLLQRNNIVANSSEKNPIVVDLDNQLASMRGALVHSIDNVVMTLQKQLSSQQSFAGHASSKIAQNPNQARHLLSEERQQKVKEALYLFLLQKREENELSQAFTAYNTRVVSTPHGSKAPTSPVTKKILLIALVLGMGIPFAYLYLRETMNTKVRSLADIKKKVSMPYLGEVPLYHNNVKPKKYEFWKKKSNEKHKDIVVKDGSRGMLNEAYRIIATNLEFMSSKTADKGNLYMVTSYNQGSGKSFITANLGAILAVKKSRVLLVDGDFRHASISEYFRATGKGLADYLSGRVDNINSILLKSEQFPTLSVLPVGTIPPNPSELLSLPEFGTLLESLKSEYDYIIVDCPPADMMADATIVGRYADRTIFIVRAGLFERSMVSQLEDDYNSGKFKNMVLILNATYGVGGHYGYGYHYGYKYGYKYGYHYGYGNKSED